MLSRITEEEEEEDEDNTGLTSFEEGEVGCPPLGYSGSMLLLTILLKSLNDLVLYSFYLVDHESRTLITSGLTIR